MAQHLKGETARPHDHPGLKFGDRDPGAAQGITRFLARLQMFGKFTLAVTETTKIDQLMHACVFGRVGKIGRSIFVALAKLVTAAHAVNQIIGDLNLHHRRCQRLRLEHIPVDNFHLFQPRPPLKAPPATTRQQANMIARCQQPRHQTPPHIAGCTGNKNRVGLGKWHGLFPLLDER